MKIYLKKVEANILLIQKNLESPILVSESVKEIHNDNDEKISKSQNSKIISKTKKNQKDHDKLKYQISILQAQKLAILKTISKLDKINETLPTIK